MVTTGLESLRILLVEDEPFFQEVVAKILRGLGVSSVTSVKNGAEAIDTLSNVPGFFDLIISDIEMPEMAGFELVRRIRYGVVPRYKDIPILMLTGHSTEGNVQKGKFHKIQGFIVKPPSPEALKRHITRALRINPTPSA